MNQADNRADERFAVLETKLAYQEQTIKELDALVYEQGSAINRLETMLKLLTDKLKSLDSGTSQPMAASERPPHY